MSYPSPNEMSKTQLEMLRQEVELGRLQGMTQCLVPIDQLAWLIDQALKHAR